MFTFGCDPEVMLVDNNGKLVSAIGILPDKDDALPKDGNKFYFDNMLAEIAVKPASTKKEAIENIRLALKGLCECVKPFKIEIKASANYPKKEINCFDAVRASCEPEWNVYTLKENYLPDENVDLINGNYQFKTPFRSAGGHIHLGSEKLYDSIFAFATVRMMDLFIGIPSLFLDKDPSSKERRKIYGHAGSHRIPDHGLEYRALGNFWLTSPRHVSLIYDLTSFVFEFVDKKEHENFLEINESLLDEEDQSLAYNCFGFDCKSLTECIDNWDMVNAEKFMLFIKNYLPEELILEIEELSKEEIKNPYVEWNLK